MKELSYWWCNSKIQNMAIIHFLLRCCWVICCFSLFTFCHKHLRQTTLITRESGDFFKHCGKWRNSYYELFLILLQCVKSYYTIIHLIIENLSTTDLQHVEIINRGKKPYMYKEYWMYNIDKIIKTFQSPPHRLWFDERYPFPPFRSIKTYLQQTTFPFYHNVFNSI